MRKNCKKLIKKKIRIEKVIKNKGYKLYVKWQRSDDSFNGWINKKDII